MDDERIVIYLNFEDLFVAFVIADQKDFLSEVLKLNDKTFRLCLHGNKCSVFPYLQEEVFHISIQVQPQRIHMNKFIPVSVVILQAIVPIQQN